MPFVSSATKREFLASEQAAWAREQLKAMVVDTQYNTPGKPSYTHGDVDMSFVEWHIMYLCDHPQLKPNEYLSNLRLKTKRW